MADDGRDARRDRRQRILLAIQDVTERQRGEDVRRQLAMIVGSSGDAIISVQQFLRDAGVTTRFNRVTVARANCG